MSLLLFLSANECLIRHHHTLILVRYITNFIDYLHISSKIAASLESAAFAKGFQVEAKKFNRTGFSEDTNRQLEKLLYIGDAAIEDDNLFEEVSAHI